MYVSYVGIKVVSIYTSRVGIHALVFMYRWLIY